MDNAKQKQFAGIIGGIILLYIGLYWFIVSPVYNDPKIGISASKKKIQSTKKYLDKFVGKKSKSKKRKRKRKKRGAVKALPVLPNPKLIKYHNERKTKLTNSLASIEKIYESKSESLKKSFDDLKGRQGDPVSIFLPVYDKEVQNIVKRYSSEESPIKIGEVKNDDDFFDENEIPDKGKEIKDVLKFENKNNIPDDEAARLQWIEDAQKKFWIIKYFLDIMEESELQALSKFFVEKKDTGEYFEKYAINATGKIYYKNAPVFIKNILNSQKLLTEIKNIEIKRDENYTVKTIKVTIPHDENISREVMEKKVIEKEREKLSKPETVSIKISCEILNYINKK